MTEDHRVASATERARIARTGQPLKDGEVRLNGMIFCSVSIEFFSHLRWRRNQCWLFQQD